MKLFSKRTGPLGLLSDVVMVAAAAFRVARKPEGGRGSRRAAVTARPMELLLVAGAAWRILGRVRQVRRNRRAARVG